MQRDKHMEI